MCIENPKESINECITCELYCCGNCSVNHLAKARFSHHKVLSISKTKLIVCIEHYLELEFFCVDEKVLVCSSCLEKHQSHYVISKNDAQNILGPEALNCKAKIQSAIEIIKADKTKLFNHLQAIDTQENNDFDHLSTMCEKNIQSIKTFESEARKNISNAYVEVKSSISQKINNLTVIEKQIESLITEEDVLEVLQKSFPFLNIKPYATDLKLPKFTYTPFNSPVLSLSSPLQDLFYLNRGTREYYVYSIASKELSVKELPNDSPTISRWSSFTTLSDGRILITGGKVDRNSGSHKICMFIDPYNNLYYPAIHMIKGHSSHIALRIFNKVFIISGKNEDNVCDSFCEVFDLYKEIWTPIGKINFPRTCAAGSFVRNFIYVIGGFQNSVSNAIERYSLQSNE